MLQFIVLGLVPGTHFQITFDWYQILLLVVLIVGGRQSHKAHAKKIQQAVQKQLTVISLSSLDRA